MLSSHVITGGRAAVGKCDEKPNLARISDTGQAHIYTACRLFILAYTPVFP